MHEQLTNAFMSFTVAAVMCINAGIWVVIS